MRFITLTFLSFFVVASTVWAEIQSAPVELKTDGELMFNAICGGMCHEAPEPSALNEKQWPIVLNKMQQRMNQMGIPPLSEAHRDVILDYLLKKAL
jgi:hypothetical protein